jgi:predicted dehydrogenase
MSETVSLGIIMNGVTGRMGANQHLVRSILALRQAGGLLLPDGRRILPQPVLAGRNPEKLHALSMAHGGLPYATDLNALLNNPAYPIYFDAQTTPLRAEAVRWAIAAGKHVYCEKPIAMSSSEALALYRSAKAAGVKHGVVQDKLWLPGILKLRRLIEEGFFGTILSVRAEFGYWVFTGEDGTPQRPSWNYRAEDGGGIISDMFCHFDYLIAALFGPVSSLCCHAATHVPRRRDEAGREYACTADDAAYATFLTASNIVVQLNASWCVRVRRDDLLTLQVDGTQGSAVAGLRDCLFQPAAATPRPVWNPDTPKTADYFADWAAAPDIAPELNAFRAQWELFLRHVVLDDPFPWDFLAGARGVRLAELGYQAARERRWVEVPPLVP